MSKKDDSTITSKEFIKKLRSYHNGSITRRQFLGITGLGTAMAVMGTTVPSLLTSTAHAADLGKRLNIATWPNYQDDGNFEKFTKDTGVNINVSVFGSNEEMLAKLQAGGTGWDVFVPTNYTISTYKKLDLIESIDLSKLPNFNAATNEKRFTSEGNIDGETFAIPKNWGTTGFVNNTAKTKKSMTTWKEFWEGTMDEYSGRTIVHDYQLTTIGNALVYFGNSFNSIDEKELAQAEKLLIEAKPHLFAVTSDYQPGMRNEDAWLSMCWTGDGKQLNKDMSEIEFVLGKEGGEIWSDFYAVPKNAPNREAAYAFINFMQDPAINAKECLAHGYPLIDSRATDLLPEAVKNDPILYPAAELLSSLEFGAAATLTSPLRAEVMARFKSA